MKDAPEHGGSGVSIHAPTKGATLSFLASVDFFDSFNPRSHEGSDITDKEVQSMAEVVSIHAPTKGATQRPYSAFQHPCCFNPRSHEGSDAGDQPHDTKHQCFNPRSHEGSDASTVGCSCPIVRFQSTLPRRERQE